MCDSLCALGSGRSFFAKNSDRPVGEVQLVAAAAPRRGGGAVSTQYLSIADPGAGASLLARPSWLWGAEHGVNDRRVAIGNEEVFTTSGTRSAPAALIGMDLVRLALERAGTAAQAVETITGLLAGHGQGGVANPFGHSYDSSFLIADPGEAYVLETAGRTWAAKPVTGSIALSNRLSLRTDWTAASGDVAAGTDFDRFRDPAQPTAHADLRLAAGHRFLGDDDPGAVDARQLVAHLRDHGTGGWGAPGTPGEARPLPPPLAADFTGFSVCMHIRGVYATASSMVAELPADPAAPARAWVAPGSPCVSVYLPVFPPQASVAAAVPDQLASEALWHRVDALRQRCEADDEALPEIRSVLDAVEAEIWAAADDVTERPEQWGPVVADGARLWEDRLGALAG